VFGFIFAIIYHRNYGDFISPIIFTIIIITLSTIYSYKYRRVVKKALRTVKNAPLPQDKANVDICVEQIHKTIKSILSVSKAKRNLLLVTNFFQNIDDIEEAVKKLHDNYKKSKNFLDNKRNIVTEQDLEELQKKIENTDDSKRELIQAIYDNKKKIYDEIENIRGSLMESLLNLQYILSNLQQIEVTINSVSVSVINETNTRDIREASSTLETFSEELKGSLNKMRL
jgi:methyl-accepting chemotaxis protein